MPIYDYVCPDCGEKKIDHLIRKRGDDIVFCQDRKCGTLMRKLPSCGSFRWKQPGGVYNPGFAERKFR
ncbi:hypothetical protein KAR91_38570 [Candidatus Pacearchaeota archaeon]|nr:hypothetical protein [Candidatus Pacearchaeota archaeon]